VVEDKQRPSRVITVRTTSVLHEALKAEAHRQQMSLNELCNSKLSQGMDLSQLPPTEAFPQ
jgi:predicted HicB family RNase H-like nuclease